MKQEELKALKDTMDERAKGLIDSLKLEGNEQSVVTGLKKGDTFKLVGMDKIEVKQRQGSRTKFVPIVFKTDNGATIGAKHFTGIEFDDDEAPIVGGTPKENATFLVWCQDHKVTFSVSKVKTEDIEAKDDIPAYTRKTYELNVDEFWTDEELVSGKKANNKK